MTLDPVHPKEYKFSTNKNDVLITHMGICQRPFIGMAFDLAEAIKKIDEHEKQWHRAKVIQMHSERLQKIDPL